MVDDIGLYFIEAKVSGCIVRDNIEVIAEDDCELPTSPPLIPAIDCHTHIPNAISLSSIRSNAAFAPVSNCELQDYRLEIYDRWGELIYMSNNPEFSWDGSNVNTGVYSYAIGYRYALDSDMIYHSGTVTVVR